MAWPDMAEETMWRLIKLLVYSAPSGYYWHSHPHRLPTETFSQNASHSNSTWGKKEEKFFFGSWKPGG